MKRIQTITALLLGTALIIAGLIVPSLPVLEAQVRVSATPVRVVLPTQTLPATEIALPTPTPTETATPEGIIIAQVPDGSSEINVRALPDPNAERLGGIQAGERYSITGRYFSWLQIEFPGSPNGRGWVFDQLVQIVGNAADIPEINPFSQQAAPIEQAEGTLTAEALIVVPGGELTATAEARIIILPTNEAGEVVVERDILPTFTPPPELIATPDEALIEDINEITEFEGTLFEAITSFTQDGIAPIVPIGLLAGFGLLGLLVAVARS